MSQPELRLDLQAWPYRRPFGISRGVLDTQHILHATATWGDVQAQGEAEPHESDLALAQQVTTRGRQLLPWLGSTLNRDALRQAQPADGLRNALDALLWDLECKRSGRRAWELAGLERVDASTRVATMFTVTLDTADAMAQQARDWTQAQVLKVKLGDSASGGLDRDIERLFAVAAARPGCTLTVDPNEGWTPSGLQRFAQAVRGLPLALIEQPLPAGQEDLLPSLGLQVPVAADEACTTLASMARLAGLVQYVNLKLDKSGGLTEALLMCDEADRLGLKLMIGCNCGTSLAMAPAFLVATRCEFVDLDGPWHLRDDRPAALRYDGAWLPAPSAALWG
jgi:L-alanine-DL-glutamate epimerase-like enolase superfamily enzyme